MAQKSGGRSKQRNQMVSAGLYDAQADELAVGDAKKEVQDNAIEDNTGVVCAPLRENHYLAELKVSSLMRSSQFSDEITSEEVTSYSTTSCENSQEKGRILFDDSKACLSTIAAEYLTDRNDLRLNLYEGSTNKKLEREKGDTRHEGTKLFYQCLKMENLIGKSHFVCRSGLLTKLCKTPFIGGKYDHGMILAVQKIGSTCYMQSFETDGLKRWQESKDEAALRSEYGGKRFEVLVSANSDSSTAYNFDEEYVSVRKIQFGGHSLIIRGEIDGCLPTDQSYVEIKTATDGYDDLHPVQALGWWFQCELVRAENVLCGFRNYESGVVNRIKWFKVEDQIKKPQTQKSRKIGLQCLKDVLDFVKRNVKNDYQPYYMEREKGSKTFRLYQDETPDEKYKFLPKWLYENKQP